MVNPIRGPGSKSESGPFPATSARTRAGTRLQDVPAANRGPARRQQAGPGVPSATPHPPGRTNRDGSDGVGSGDVRALLLCSLLVSARDEVPLRQAAVMPRADGCHSRRCVPRPVGLRASKLRLTALSQPCRDSNVNCGTNIPSVRCRVYILACLCKVTHFQERQLHKYPKGRGGAATDGLRPRFTCPRPRA